MGSSSLKKRMGVGIGLSAISAVFQLLAFCVNNLLAHTLGAAAFADYVLIATDLSIFSVIAEFGTGALILSFFATRLGNPSIAQAIFRLRVGLGAFACAAMVIVSQFAHALDGLALPCAILALGLLCSPAVVEWFFLGTRDWKNLVRFKLIHAAAYLVGGLALWASDCPSLEAVCLMVSIAPLPAFCFALTRLPKTGRALRRSQRKLVSIVLCKAVPYATSSLAGFAYLPAILYAVNLCWSAADDKAAFSSAYKIIILLQAFTLQFLASEQIFSQRRLSLGLWDKSRRTLAYTGIASLGTLPLALLGAWTPRLLFFGLQWTPEMMELAEQTIRVLLISIVLQFARMPALAQILADRRIRACVAITLIGGVANLFALAIAARFAPQWLMIAGLTGDMTYSALVVLYYLRLNAAQEL